MHTLDFGHFLKIHPVVRSHIKCSVFFLKTRGVGLRAQLCALIWAGQAPVCALGPTPERLSSLSFWGMSSPLPRSLLVASYW